jgi:putative spermidine/putrescine transport system substrate-binding protein
MRISSNWLRIDLRGFIGRITSGRLPTRVLLRGIAAFVALVPISGISLGASDAVPQNLLRVLAWPGYADADVVKQFETRFHAKVQVTFVDSDETLWEQMHRGSPPAFDVLAANTAEIQRYTQHNLLAPLDVSKIPNTRLQLPMFRQRSTIGGIEHDGTVYAIPFTYSSMGLIYDRKQVSVEPRSMLELWNPQYRGRTLDFNSAQHNFSFAALALGYRDPFHLTPAQMRTVTHKLIELRRNLLTLYTLPEEATALFVEHHAAMMFGNYGTQQIELLRRAGVDVGYVIPDEGALAWLDCWAITRGARNRALALSWINYMLEPEVSGLLPQRQGLASTLGPASGHAADNGKHLFWIQPVEDIAQRESLWRRIVSGEPPERFPR